MSNGSNAGNPSDYELLKQARERLDDAVKRDTSGDQDAWLHGVQQAARAVYDALERHQESAEHEGGALPEATGQKPALSSEVHRLEHEHTDMLHRAEELEEEIQRQFEFQDYNREMVRLQASVLHDILQLHLLRTDALMYEAYFRVEGGEQG